MEIRRNSLSQIAPGTPRNETPPPAEDADLLQAQPSAVVDHMGVVLQVVNPVVDGAHPAGPGPQSLLARVASSARGLLPSAADSRVSTSMALYGTLGGIAGGPFGATLGVTLGYAIGRGQVQVLGGDSTRLGVTYVSTVIAGVSGVAISALSPARGEALAALFGGVNLVADGVMTSVARQFEL